MENAELIARCDDIGKCHADDLRKIRTIELVVKTMKAADEGNSLGAHKDWLACHDWLYHWLATGQFEWEPPA